MKCGGCGIRSNMTNDIAHALILKWRHLKKQQKIVLAGKLGKQALLKPFSRLIVVQLAEELHSRSVSTTGLTKSEMELNYKAF